MVDNSKGRHILKTDGLDGDVFEKKLFEFFENKDVNIIDKEIEKLSIELAKGCSRERFLKLQFKLSKCFALKKAYEDFWIVKEIEHTLKKRLIGYGIDKWKIKKIQ